LEQALGRGNMFWLHAGRGFGSFCGFVTGNGRVVFSDLYRGGGTARWRFTIGVVALVEHSACERCPGRRGDPLLALPDYGYLTAAHRNDPMISDGARSARKLAVVPERRDCSWWISHCCPPQS
jgi:hypothetical protein